MKLDNEYKAWISEVKRKVRSAQIKAAVAVNKELILFYWDLGKMIFEKLQQSSWGDKVLTNVSKDLKDEFPNMKGFSVTNLKYIKSFYEYFSLHLGNDDELASLQIGHQLGDQMQPSVDKRLINSQQVGGQIDPRNVFIRSVVVQIPWRHIIEIITKARSFKETVFYIQKTKENNWSRNTLALQIKSNLYQRSGKAVSNFKKTPPEPLSDLAQETLKDPYVFDFLQLSEKYKEKDLENQLVFHIRKFLLELGKGFAFVGQQYHIEIADKDYYLDLLFYHIKLKCYVVIELKNTEFIPEYTGKLNFYLSTVDSILKEPEDKPSIGILLCRDKNNIEAEFALRDINKPIGVSGFELTNVLPENLKSSLPTIEELEQNLLKDE